MANLLPLSFQRKDSLCKYACRVLANDDNPYREDILNFYNYTSHLLVHSLKPSVTKRAHLELNRLHIAPSNIGHTPIHFKLNSYPPFALKDLHLIRKENFGADIWRLLFKRLLVTYSEFYHIYTDGSVRDSSSSCAVWSTNLNIKSKLPITPPSTPANYMLSF